MGKGGDSPVLANLYSHYVQDADILLISSDGLFDNMSNV